MQKILKPGGTEILPQSPDNFQRTNLNVLHLSSTTNQGPKIAGIPPTVNNEIKEDFRRDLYKGWQWDYKFLKLLPVGIYFPLMHGYTTTNYQQKKYLLEVNHFVVDSSLETCLNYPMNELSNEWTIKACWNILRSLTPLKEDTQLGTKKWHMDSTALLFPQTKNFNQPQELRKTLKTFFNQSSFLITAQMTQPHTFCLYR
mgnify:FL=1